MQTCIQRHRHVNHVCSVIGICPSTNPDLCEVLVCLDSCCNFIGNISVKRVIFGIHWHWPPCFRTSVTFFFLSAFFALGFRWALYFIGWFAEHYWLLFIELKLPDELIKNRWHTECGVLETLQPSCYPGAFLLIRKSGLGAGFHVTP